MIILFYFINACNIIFNVNVFNFLEERIFNKTYSILMIFPRSKVGFKKIKPSFNNIVKMFRKYLWFVGNACLATYRTIQCLSRFQLGMRAPSLVKEIYKLPKCNRIDIHCEIFLRFQSSNKYNIL